MRDKLYHILVFAMAFVEAARGIADLRHHLRRLRAKALRAQARGEPLAARHWTRRYREWASFTVVAAIAVIPTFYYMVHAANS